MLNGGIDQAIAGPTEASVVHPWLPLPPPSTTFFPMSAVRRRRRAAGSNDQKQEEECSKTQHFGGGWVGGIGVGLINRERIAALLCLEVNLK